MNIVEKTTAQLVRNRVHDLVDLAMDVNENSTSIATLHVSSSSAHIVIKGARGLIRACDLPPMATTASALRGLEDIIADVRGWAMEGSQ